MATCYKNFPLIVTYGDATSDTIYGNSASLSENLELQHAASFGLKGETAVFNTSVPKGNLSVESYVMEDLTNFNNLKGSNDQNITIQFGPYNCPAPCVLSSMSININVGEPVTVSRQFDYFGSATSGAAPAPGSPTVSPVVPESVGFVGFDQISGSANIKRISWNFTQSYQDHNLIGERVPLIVFDQGQIELTIEGDNLTIPLLSGDSSTCVIPPKAYTLSLSGCNGENLGTLSLTGYMQSRDASVSADDPETNSVSIIQYL